MVVVEIELIPQSAVQDVREANVNSQVWAWQARSPRSATVGWQRAILRCITRSGTQMLQKGELSPKRGHDRFMHFSLLPLDEIHLIYMHK